ncbi:unnamed protein product, partial [Laminaria digitata]
RRHTDRSSGRRRRSLHLQPDISRRQPTSANITTHHQTSRGITTQQQTLAEMLGCSWFGFWRRRLAAPLQVRQTPPLVRYRKYHELARHEGVGFAAGTCISINLVMGSGFLALPSAFVSTGLVLGTAVLLVCMGLLRMTAMYEVETMCRAEVWVKANLVPLVNKRRAREGPEAEMKLSSHAFQMTEMCELFGGRRLQRAFNLCLFLYMFCALWGYGAVFGQSLATYAPVPFLGETGAYRLYVVLFSFIVVPLSTLDIKEQAAFQVVLTVLRFFALVLMVGSIAMSLSTGGEPFGPGTEMFVGTPEMVHWRGLFKAVPAGIFALSLSSTTSTIVGGLERKHSVGRVVWAALISATVTYIFISVATAYYFGESVDGSCNVNWVQYHPIGNGPAATLLATLGRFLAYFVVLFPAMDVTSVYPLNVMVVANNMMAAVYNDHVDNAENDSVIVTTFRIACAVPPLLWALLFKDFAAIVGYAGCLTVLIAFVFPAYLNLISQRMCNERFGASKTPFTGAVTSSTPALMACMAFGGVLFSTLVVSDVVSLVSIYD